MPEKMQNMRILLLSVHHHKPVVLICRGAYINHLAASAPIEQELKAQLLNLYKGCDRIICIARHLAESINRVVGVNNTLFLPNPNEGRPHVLQEAIAAGKGVVAYDNPGSREVVNEWSTQWPYTRLIPIGDRFAASQGIIDLASNFRSNPQPLPPPQLPKPMEVLYQYESMLKSLKVQSVSGVFVATEPETTLSL